MSSSDPSPASRLGLTPGITIDGGFRLQRLLGAGGGGEVWEAEEAVDAEAWRSIALKLLRTPDRGARQASSGSPSSDHDWLHEARAVSQVSCEALPRIHGVGVAKSPPVPFIAMELLQGETLEKRLGRGPLHWRRALAVARQIAVALDACHAAGVVHCDLKPRNVFLEDTGRRRVLVLDFGVASLGGSVAPIVPSGSGGPRSVEETDVQASEAPAAPEAQAAPLIVGTPAYISPERLTGLLPDHHDDAFALGVVLHRMIAGRLPQKLPPGVGAVPSSHSPGHKTGPGPYGIALHRATVERQFERLADVARGTPHAVANLVATLLGPAAERPAKGELERLVDDVYRRPHGRPAVPYAGLEAFGEQRTGYLPGRAADVAAIVRRLADQVGMVLCGPSGAGKSSLAVAGVAARVDEEMLLDMEGWVTVALRPSSGRAGLCLAEGEAAPRPNGPPVGTLVVVDQLEEVLSLGDGDQRAFCRAFSALVTRRAEVAAGERRIGPEDAVRVVATVRDDLFGRVAALPELERLPEQNLYVVRGVDPNAAREIVEGPLDGTGYTLDRAEGVGLVADVARELERDASALPLVQFALARLWKGRDEAARVLRARSWKEIGGIGGALGEAAQGWFDKLGAEERVAARRLFLELFDVEGTRRVVDEGALDAAAVALVPRLVAEGLVRRRVAEAGKAVIEPLHEALAKGWPLLGRWLEEVRADRELVRDAERDGERWARHGRPDDMLWGGTLLKNAEVLEAIKDLGVREFVWASLAAAERARRRASLVKILAGAAGVMVFATTLTGWWWTYSAKQNVDEANRRLDAALVESRDNEAEATKNAEEARRQTAVAEARQRETEAAKKKVAELGREYEQKFDRLSAATDRALKERRLELLKEAKRDIDQNRPASASVAKPPASVVPPVGSPFNP